jgi:polar amino acid transport system substrate-binding protein
MFFLQKIVSKGRRVLAPSVLLLLLSTHPSLGQELLTLVNDPWPPYTSETLPGKGLATEIVTTALHRAGYSTQVTFAPWTRALNGTFDGTYDILVTTSYSDERAKTMAYSDPYLSQTVRFIKRSGATHQFNSLEDLRGLTVGVTQGYIYEPAFDEATHFVKDGGAEDTVANLKKLKNNRLDLIAEDELVARYYMQKNFLPDEFTVDYISPPLHIKNLHIIIRKARIDHTDVIDAFNEALASMRDDGTYNSILARHGFDSYQSIQ